MLKKFKFLHGIRILYHKEFNYQNKNSDQTKQYLQQNKHMKIIR